MSEPIWTKRDGTKIRVVDMDDAHLGSAIAMLERAQPPYVPNEADYDVEVELEKEYDSYFRARVWLEVLREAPARASHRPVRVDLTRAVKQLLGTKT